MSIRSIAAEPMAHTSSTNSSRLAIIDALFIFVGACVIIIASLWVFHSSKAKPTSSATSSTSATGSSSTSNPYAVLSPATVPSKTAECNQAISFSSNGDSGPVQCSNGDLNATEWNSLSALEPTVMTLGYSATIPQIQSALCSDANASDSDANTKNSNVIEQTVYQISALYYGWNFSSNPTSILTDGGC